MDCKNCPVAKFALPGKGVSVRRQEKMSHPLRFILSHPQPAFTERAIFGCNTTSIFDRFVREPNDIVFTKQCVQSNRIEDSKGATAMEREARACCEPTFKEDLVGAKVIVACGNEALQGLGYSRKAGDSVGWIEYNEELGATVLACLDPHKVEENPDALAKDFIWTVQKAEQIVRGFAPRENILPDVKWVKVDTVQDFLAYTGHYKTGDFMVVDIETTGLDFRNDKILQLGIYSPGYEKNLGLVLTPELFTKREFKRLWADLCSRMVTVMHNGKFDAKFLEYQHDLRTPIGYDCLPIHQMIDERTGTHSLGRLLRVYLNWKEYWTEIEHYLKLPGGYGNAPFDDLALYLAYDLVGTYELLRVLLALLRDDKLSKRYPWDIMLSQREYVDKILNPVNNELKEVEREGFITDEARLDYLIAEAIPSVDRQRRAIEDTLLAETGKEYSVDSPVQLIEALHKMGALPEEIQSTQSKVIKDYIKVPIIKQILEYKKEYKMLTAFYNSIKEKLVDDYGLKKTFATFNIAGTIGSRWSGANPNLQQAPRAPHPFKSIFVPGKGKIIFQNDFTSLEVCMAAWLSKDKALIEACKPGADMHMTVAKSAFAKFFVEMSGLETTEQWKELLNRHALLLAAKKNIEDDAQKRGTEYSAKEYEEAIIKHLRSCAKTITFGIFFGRGARALAEQELNCTISEAQTFIDNYFKLFPDFNKWIRKVHWLVKDVGIIVAPDGRVRDLRYWMFSSDPMRRKQALARACRQAVNFLTQNMAGTVNNMAFIKVARYLREHNIGRATCAVHDSTIGEIVLNKDTQKHLAAIRELQNGCLTSDLVSFRVDTEAGLSWGGTVGEEKFFGALGTTLLEVGFDKVPRAEAQDRVDKYLKMTRVRKMTPEELAKENLRPELADELEQLIKEQDEKWLSLK